MSDPKNITKKRFKRRDIDMTLRVCNVEVMQFPEALTVKRARHFLGELESCMANNRPCIVLNCSNVRKMDRSVTHLLLCCLEEAIKRNGDVKLSAVPAAARTILELTGVNRLFEVFDTNDEALSSFHLPPTRDALQQAATTGSPRDF
jgi:anti-anti-sigma factor